MIESFFKQRSTIARLQSAPLIEHFPFIIQVLQDERYRPDSIRKYLRATEKFGLWLTKRGLRTAEIDETTITRYRSSVSRRSNGQLRAAARGLPKILMLLRKQHAVDEPAAIARTENELLIDAFNEHLEHVAGLLPGTRTQYSRYANLFLKAAFSGEPFNIAKVTPQVIVDFVRVQADKLKPSACAAPTTAMRVFLRFLVADRGLEARFVGAVPTVRQWKLASLPRYLSVEQVERTLASCDARSPVGVRDRAILLLMLRLALRAGEVARLQFADIDWREGELRIHSPKSARERKMPLPHDVGQALAEYVRNARPRSTQPYVFLRTRAPFSPITGPTAVSCIAKRHLKLAGIVTRGLSAHAFRHTAATQMVRCGASFKQVADVLGHRLLETTNIYAKLDEDTLHRVALPWPGGQQ